MQVFKSGYLHVLAHSVSLKTSITSSTFKSFSLKLHSLGSLSNAEYWVER